MGAISLKLEGSLLNEIDENLKKTDTVLELNSLGMLLGVN